MQLTIFTDGGSRSNPGPAAIGVVVMDVTNNKTIHEYKEFIGTETNNVAEYLALTYAVNWLKRFCETTDVQSCEFLLDSMLVVEQVQGHWKIKEPRLRELATTVQDLLKKLPCTYSFRHIPRAQNAEADKLVNQALDAELA
jgi:probable phosphoglycerate mutase